MNGRKKDEHADVYFGKGILHNFKDSSINFNSIEVSYGLVKDEQDGVLSCIHYDF